MEHSAENRTGETTQNNKSLGESHGKVLVTFTLLWSFTGLHPRLAALSCGALFTRNLACHIAIVVIIITLVVIFLTIVTVVIIASF